MAKTSAGILVYRNKAGVPEVFLVHPGGPFYARKDLGVWSIPKGEYQEGEEALNAARREFLEETGIELSGDFFPLTPFTQKSGKSVSAWAHENDFDAGTIVSNTFEMEWPPKSGKRNSFPEVDKGQWFNVDQAMEKILPAQQVMLIELTEKLGWSHE